MNYQESIAYLEEYGRLGSVYGLDRMEALLACLDNPHLALQMIHLAGTNGKGSVSNMISRVLCASGYRVGLFNSPYVLSYRETLQINHMAISESDFAQTMTRIASACDLLADEGHDHPTVFEMVTAAAFLYFQEQAVDFAVIEAGLGGLTDSTNVHPKPVLSLITSVSFDHMALLGASLSEIATAKAGIIKQGCPVISGLLDQEAMLPVISRAKSLDSPITIINPAGYNIHVFEKSLLGTRLSVNSSDLSYDSLLLPLLGTHQIQNLLMALETVHQLKDQGYDRITYQSVCLGIAQTRWTCRCEYIPGEVDILFDGAHNVESLSAFIQVLSEQVSKPVTLLFGVLGDKPFDKMVSLLSPFAQQIVVTQPLNPRALPVEVLEGLCKPCFNRVMAIKDPYRAFDYALELAKKTDTVLCCVGSLSLAIPLRDYYYS